MKNRTFTDQFANFPQIRRLVGGTGLRENGGRFDHRIRERAVESALLGGSVDAAREYEHHGFELATKLVFPDFREHDPKQTRDRSSTRIVEVASVNKPQESRGRFIGKRMCRFRAEHRKSRTDKRRRAKAKGTMQLFLDIGFVRELPCRLEIGGDDATTISGRGAIEDQRGNVI